MINKLKQFFTMSTCKHESKLPLSLITYSKETGKTVYGSACERCGKIWFR